MMKTRRSKGGRIHIANVQIPHAKPLANFKIKRIRGATRKLKNAQVAGKWTLTTNDNRQSTTRPLRHDTTMHGNGSDIDEETLRDAAAEENIQENEGLCTSKKQSHKRIHNHNEIHNGSSKQQHDHNTAHIGSSKQQFQCTTRPHHNNMREACTLACGGASSSIPSGQLQHRSFAIESIDVPSYCGIREGKHELLSPDG